MCDSHPETTWFSHMLSLLKGKQSMEKCAPIATADSTETARCLSHAEMEAYYGFVTELRARLEEAMEGTTELRRIVALYPQRELRQVGGLLDKLTNCHYTLLNSSLLVTELTRLLQPRPGLDGVKKTPALSCLSGHMPGKNMG